MKITQKSWTKRLFCKHQWVEATKVELFQIISGETIYTICEKCGKIHSTRFVRYG